MIDKKIIDTLNKYLDNLDHSHEIVEKVCVGDKMTLLYRDDYNNLHKLILKIEL